MRDDPYPAAQHVAAARPVAVAVESVPAAPVVVVAAADGADVARVHRGRLGVDPPEAAVVNVAAGAAVTVDFTRKIEDAKTTSSRRRR